jgi:hypothetical protein
LFSLQELPFGGVPEISPMQFQAEDRTIRGSAIVFLKGRYGQRGTRRKDDPRMSFLFWVLSPCHRLLGDLWGRNMAIRLDPKELVSFEELLKSQVVCQDALIKD